MVGVECTRVVEYELDGHDITRARGGVACQQLGLRVRGRVERIGPVLQFAAVGVAIAVLVIGVIGYVLYSRKADDAELVFPATEVGTPAGDKVTRNIGPEGGTLVSPDGRLTLTVPANTLTLSARAGTRFC